MSASTRAVFPFLLLSLACLASAPSASAKGITVAIEIDGASLAATLEITDPAIVEEFSIWEGPNSGWVMPDGSLESSYEHAFIDFPGGPVEAPRGELLEFEVRFRLASERGAEPLEMPYTVRYAVDPQRPGGYMYLPTTGQSYIWHGVEDNWFRSTRKWEELVRPALEAALGRASRHP